MQSEPNKYSQFFMTVIGLSLLVMALVMNHLHPRNQGVASVTRKSIYKLNLNFASVAPSGNADLGYSSLVNLPPETVKSKGSATQSAPTPPPPAAVDESSTVTVASSTKLSCDDLDAKQINIAQKAFDNSYKAYLKKKSAAVKTASHTDSADNQSDGSDYYSDYLNDLNQDYAAYQQSLAAANCTGAMVAPVPQDQ